MTILWLDGFEWLNTIDDLGYRYDNYRMSYYTTLNRWGGGCIGHSYVYSGDIRQFLPNLDTYTTVAMGFAYRSSVYTDERLFAYFHDKSYTCQVALRTDANGVIVAYRGDGGTELGRTDADVLLPGTWQFIEFKVYIHDTAGTVQVRVDQQTVLNLTSQDTRNGTAYIDMFRLDQPGGNRSTFFCDLWITDGALLGDCRVRTIKPDSDETHHDFTPSTGVDNYAMVDDATPDDDSTYNQSSAKNAKDTFGVTLTAPGKIIKAVQVSNITRKYGNQGATIQNIIRSGGADYNVGNELLLTTTYKRLFNVAETDPQDSQPWTYNRLDAAEFGYEITGITTTSTTTTTTTTTTS